MNLPIVVIRNLTLNYEVRNANTYHLKQVALNVLKKQSTHLSIEALKQIDFSIYPGEILGIVGDNGAGKSSLLRVIAGILKPSSGDVNVQGRCFPLIELGAGFNYELTCRDNIVYFGVLLGNSRKAMESAVEQIAVWAGVENCLELPLRTFSTGMVARLGFAIATFKTSGILLIDETLSVGDQEFRQKSLAKINEIISEGQATIMVSHDIELLASLCTKILWIEKGFQRMIGSPREVIDAYRNA